MINLTEYDKLIEELSPSEAKRLKFQYEMSHHIPTVVLLYLEKLEHIDYGDILSTFMKNYIEKDFSNTINEYEFIFIYLNQIFKKYFPDKFITVLENDFLSAKIHSLSTTDVKERFIHPFQNFLVGIIIINKYYERFKQYYSKDLGNNPFCSVEVVWLLASIFHDREKHLRESKNTLQNLEEIKDWNEEDDPDEEIYIDFIEEIPDIYKNIYLKKMISLFTHLKNGNIIDEWEDNIIDDDNKIFQTLNKYINNHGVKASLQLMYHYYNKIPDDRISPGYIEAALAICLHDHKPYEDLMEINAFPIPIETMPVICLLLYCDEVQEWSRYTKLDIKTTLRNIVFEDNEITCSLSYQTHNQASEKVLHIERISNSISCKKDLYFWLSIKINAGK